MKHYPELQASQNETKRMLKRNEKEEKISREEDFGDTLLGQLRTYLWYLTEYPERTKAARVRPIKGLQSNFPTNILSE